jgi:hypothetical protein
MALTSITLADSVTVHGRALARNGNVTLINDRFMSSNCAAAPLLIPPTMPPFTIAPSPTATLAPAVGQIAVPSPTLAPTASTVAVALTTVAPANTPAPLTATGQRVLPSTSTSDGSTDLLTIVGLALAGIGFLLLARRQLRRT